MYMTLCFSLIRAGETLKIYWILLQLFWYHRTPVDQHFVMVKIFHSPYSAQKVMTFISVGLLVSKVFH